MRNTVFILAVAALPVIFVAEDAKEFVALTLISLLLLTLLPKWLYAQTSKLATYHHEMGHGLVAVLVGGNFRQFWVRRDSSGAAEVVAKDSALVVASAGYISSVLFGCIYLVKSAQVESLVLTLYVFILFYAVSIIWTADLHTAAIGLFLTGALGLVNYLAPDTLLCRLVLNLLGVNLLIEGARALWVLHLLSSTETDTGSDAEVASRHAGRHPLYWAAMFSTISIGIFLVTLIIIL